MNDKIVLVVEDFDDTRVMMKMLLEMEGCQVLEAVNGREAVEIAATHGPEINLILMDLRMPVMTGVEATRLIHERAETCHLPIVAMSAHCEGHWREDALAAGAVECVAKPVDIPVLEKLLSRFLTQL